MYVCFPARHPFSHSASVRVVGIKQRFPKPPNLLIRGVPDSVMSNAPRPSWRSRLAALLRTIPQTPLATAKIIKYNRLQGTPKDFEKLQCLGKTRHFAL